MRIGILTSGGLGLSTLTKLEQFINPEFVFTDKHSTGILEFCHKKDIPLFIGNPRGGRSQDFLNNKEVDLLFSVNYLFLVEDDILNKAKRYSINFHGSLLPKYRGRTPHVWAIINGENEVGVTAHIMIKECDAGDIVLQERIIVSAEETGNDILRRYEVLYPIMIEKIINKAEEGDLVLVSQSSETGSYFGKRTPEDGRINWDWHKERIKNWIRAQADPYPGAFCFYKNKKLIIDRVSFVDKFFDFQTTNGEILEITPNVLIKTSNGVIVLEKIRNVSEFEFVIGDKLD